MLSLLILSSLTQSSAQVGVLTSNPPKVNCYDSTESVYIATSLIKGNTCDTMLTTANKKLANRDSIIVEKDTQIESYILGNDIQRQIIQTREDTIDEKNSDIRKKTKIIKWLKGGWIASVAILVGVITIVSVK